MRPPVIDPRHGQQQQHQQQLSQYPSVQILEHIIIPAPLPQANTQTQPSEMVALHPQSAMGDMHQFPNNPAQQQQPNLPLQLPVNNGGNNHFHAPLPRGEKDMQLLREFYEHVSPPSSAAIDQEEAPPPPPPPPSHESPRWHEPSTPQELAMLSMGCLEKMLTIFQARQRNSQLQTERLERELAAPRLQDENLHRDMKFIINYMQFLKNS
ncbi:protein enabled-like [Photinus pyralis]|uniref:protein enabled-like n=1 Tax=Photinus pyralis TaxID=7054 RepID=UPI001266F6CD|nr:protein enabled-like [Photinus pyralis]